MSEEYCLMSGSLWSPRKPKTEERKSRGADDALSMRKSDVLDYRVNFDLGRYFVSLLCRGQ
tara:strand:+ start:264 stop:446 length:183 start_codon:yes stop_codon:yes gene_type:complete